MMLLSSLTCRWHIYDVHITLSVVFWLTYCLDGRLERGGAVDTDCIASSLQSVPFITWWCLLLLNHVIFISITVATFVTCLNNTWYNDNNNGLYYKWFFSRPVVSCDSWGQEAVWPRVPAEATGQSRVQEAKVAIRHAWNGWCKYWFWHSFISIGQKDFQKASYFSSSPLLAGLFFLSTCCRQLHPLRSACDQGRSLVKQFSAWNNWYKTFYNKFGCTA